MCAALGAASAFDGVPFKKSGARSAPHPTLTPPPATLNPAVVKAGNGTRTRDPNLGKVVLYQLSYSRNLSRISEADTPGSRGDHKSQSDHKANVAAVFRAQRRRGVPRILLPRHGGEGNRTPDLLNAIQALSQLSYAPSSQLSSKKQPKAVARNHQV